MAELPKDNLIWKVFWNLIVKEYIWRDNQHGRLRKCKCSCGKITITRWGALKSNRVKNCSNKIHKIKHGMRYTNIYDVWHGMIQRCNNRNSPAYKNYWWRWIRIKRKTFEEFSIDMLPTYKAGLTIDRIDNNWPYCKENCSRATRSEQALNRRLKIVSVWGIKWTIKELAQKLWVSMDTMYRRNNRCNLSLCKKIKHG